MRTDVWESMLDAEMNVRYYDYLGNRYYHRELKIKIFLAVIASGTVASWGLWNDIPLLWQILSGVSAITAIALPILNWPKMISNISNVHKKWIDIQYNYHELWNKLKEGNNDAIRTEFFKIKNNELTVTKLESNLPNDQKLLVKCQTEVLKSRGLKNKKGN